MLAAAESDQQQLLTVNGHKKSKQLARLYRTRRKRFRHAVATFARQLVKDLYGQGVSTIVIGELTGIRSNSNHSRQGNTMVHNYWSHKHLADRLNWTAEEYGIKVRSLRSLHKPDMSTMPFTTFTARSAWFPLSGLWFGGA